MRLLDDDQLSTISLSSSPCRTGSVHDCAIPSIAAFVRQPRCFPFAPYFLLLKSSDHLTSMFSVRSVKAISGSTPALQRLLAH